jgi:cystathionine gamma-lyase/cystathionine gamma-lyase/homocysteine desulfhydrase
MKPLEQIAMHKITKILHERIDLSDTHPVVTPIFQNSAFEAHSPYFYTRKDNPNVVELESVFALLEESEFAVCCATGMAAISSVLHLLEPGNTLVVNQLIYGCSYKLFQRFCTQFHLQLLVLDLSSSVGIQAIPPGVNMVIFETPTNPFLRSISIQEVAQQAKVMNPDCLVVVDNTWATPLYQQPLKFGADMSLYSATKYFSGHSDVMGGVVMTNSAVLQQKLRDTRFYQGAILDPNSAWLLRRSMQTFEIRMQTHAKVTLEIKAWLEGQQAVKKVYYPTIDGKQLTGYGTLLFFDLRDDLVDKYNEFVAHLNLFDTGTGMACVTSMVAKPYTGSHASMNDTEKEQMGLNQQLVRLSIGLEKTEDLIQDLHAAFSKLEE